MNVETAIKPQCVIAGVPIRQVMTLWPHVKEHFASFQDRSKGTVTAGRLLDDVMHGKRQCWVALDGKEVKACALTEILDGAMPVVALNFCAGKNREGWWREMVDEIERWARSKDITRVGIVCRPGWAKSLKQLGYRETHRVLERDVKEDENG